MYIRRKVYSVAQDELMDRYFADASENGEAKEGMIKRAMNYVKSKGDSIYKYADEKTGGHGKAALIGGGLLTAGALAGAGYGAYKYRKNKKAKAEAAAAQALEEAAAEGPVAEKEYSLTMTQDELRLFSEFCEAYYSEEDEAAVADETPQEEKVGLFKRGINKMKAGGKKAKDWAKAHPKTAAAIGLAAAGGALLGAGAIGHKMGKKSGYDAGFKAYQEGGNFTDY